MHSTCMLQKLQNAHEKKIKEELNKLRNLVCAWIRRPDSKNVSPPPNLYIGFVKFLSKFQEDILDADKLIPKFIWKIKGTRIAKRF